MGYMKLKFQEQQEHDEIIAEFEYERQQARQIKTYKIVETCCMLLAAGGILFFLFGCASSRPSNWPPTRFNNYEMGSIDRR